MRARENPVLKAGAFLLAVVTFAVAALSAANAVVSDVMASAAPNPRAASLRILLSLINVSSFFTSGCTSRPQRPSFPLLFSNA